MPTPHESSRPVNRELTATKRLLPARRAHASKEIKNGILASIEGYDLATLQLHCGAVVAVDVDEVNYIMSQKRPPPYIHCIYIYI